MLRGQEQERRRLAREIHDELGQHLNALQLGAAGIVSAAGTAPLASQGEQLLRGLAQVQRVVRDLVRELRPAGLDELGLVPALEASLQATRELQPAMTIRLVTFGELDGLGEELDLAVYRIVQESMTNCLRHASATSIEVVLQRQADSEGRPLLTLEVQDNGRGLPAQAMRSAGHGLAGMRERVGMLGGRFELHSMPGAGTTVRAEFPWPQEFRERERSSHHRMLVDDHAVVRAGYRRLLEGSPGIEVSGEAADVDSALSLIAAQHPDVVVLDLSMPSGSGIEVLRRLHGHPEAPRILIFSMYEDPVYAEQSLKAGARGYLTKAGGPGELVDAVHSVARGETFIDPRIARVLALRGLTATAPVGSQLSSRETEVLRLLVRGGSLREIATTLGISVKTAANHQSAIRQKLGADSAVKLLQVASRLGVS